jgi:hypothetical protein
MWIAIFIIWRFIWLSYEGCQTWCWLPTLYPLLHLWYLQLQPFQISLVLVDIGPNSLLQVTNKIFLFDQHSWVLQIIISSHPPWYLHKFWQIHFLLIGSLLKESLASDAHIQVWFNFGLNTIKACGLSWLFAVIGHLHFSDMWLG